MNSVLLNFWVALICGAVITALASYWGLSGAVSWKTRLSILSVIVVLAVGSAWYDGHWLWTADIYLGIWTVVAYVDWKEQIIPNRWVIATVIWGLLSTPWSTKLIVQHGFTALGLFIFYLVVYIITRGGLGLGDVKFGAAEGLVLGWPQGLMASVIGLWTAGIYSLILLVVFRRSRSEAIPLGPFLVLGAFSGLLGIFAGSLR